jgi:glycosyltransferase involved in cell wall biosynthesis
VLTTYEQPRALELVLWGYARQTRTDFEIVVADDGSGPETGEVIDRVRADTSLDIRRVWHENRGFRKTEILNRAIVAATGEYLIFSDGDCIPREDFVAVHISEARADTFLSGGYLKLPKGLSERLTVDDVRSGSVFKRSWLTSRGWKGGRRRLRLTRSRRVGRILDRVTPTRATWNGHNASTWKSCILAVNGFDMDMGYGGLDRALGERLVNIGVSGRQIRHRAPCLHVWHPRPYRTPEVTAANRAIRDRILANHEERARIGITELGDADAGV